MPDQEIHSKKEKREGEIQIFCDHVRQIHESDVARGGNFGNHLIRSLMSGRLRALTAMNRPLSNKTELTGESRLPTRRSPRDIWKAKVARRQ